MKISYNWLKSYISLNVSAQQLAEELTQAGQEVKKIEKANSDTVFELEITPDPLFNAGMHLHHKC